MKVVDIETLDKSRPVLVKRPVNYCSSDECWFLPWENYCTNDQDIFHLHEANVTDKGIVFNFLKKFDANFVVSHLNNKFNNFYLLKVNLLYRKIETDLGYFHVLVFDPWSARNYYHWIVDALPRLFILKERLSGCVVLLPRNARSYMHDSVKLFGPKDILEIKKHQYAKVKNLFVPRPVADSGRHDGTVLQGLKKFLLSKLDEFSGSNTTGERIYVSRAAQKVRRIKNESEVLEAVNAYGFSVIHFEEMSFVEQVSVMRKAQFVISSHGANLTNILFMPEGAKVLELNKEQSPNLCYYSLASSINLDYFYQLCPVDGPDIDNNADLVVNIRKLRENIEKMLGHS